MAMIAARPLVVIDAPSNLGLRPPEIGREPGVRRMAETLRRNGIVTRLGAIDGGVVEPAAYEDDWRPGVGHRNADAIADFSRRLAERTGKAIDYGQFPIVLGGDCSVMLGNLLALRRRGRYGLVFLDGHLDFRNPENAPSVGAAAGEELAIATGRGLSPLVDLAGDAPLIREEDIVALGEREGLAEAAGIEQTTITVWNLAHLRSIGLRESVQAALDRFAALGLDGVWIHLDVDVLDSELMPAIDSPQADGLQYAELAEVLIPLLASPLAVGIEITIYDPDLDPDGRYGVELTDALVSLIATGR